MHEELHSCAASGDDDRLINHIALCVNNAVAVIGADRVRVSHNSRIGSERFGDAIARALNERLGIGSTQDLVSRIRGHPVSIDIERRDPVSSVRPPGPPRPVMPMTRPFLPGKHCSMNIGHNMTAFGLIDVSADGYALTHTRRIRTDQLLDVNDIMRFIDGCTRDFGIPPIPSDGSDYRLSVSIAEPVFRGRVAFNQDARVSRILLELQDGPLRRLCEDCARDGTGKYFVMNDSCATGIYASRAAARYDGGLVGRISTRVLAIRFGTYSAISYIGDDGYNRDRFNEYSYLHIDDGSRKAPSETSLIGPALSYKVFRDAGRPAAVEQGEGDGEERRVPAALCLATGRTIGRLVGELQRLDPIESVIVLGSIGNGIDDIAWADMRAGIEQVVAGEESGVPPPSLTFLPGASHRSSLLGVAMEHSERLAAPRAPGPDGR